MILDPSVAELTTIVARDIINSLANRPGESAAMAAARAAAARTQIDAFAPRDAVEIMLAGQAVLFQSLAADAAREARAASSADMSRRLRQQIIALGRLHLAVMREIRVRRAVDARARKAAGAASAPAVAGLPAAPPHAPAAERPPPAPAAAEQRPPSPAATEARAPSPAATEARPPRPAAAEQRAPHPAPAKEQAPRHPAPSPEASAPGNGTAREAHTPPRGLAAEPSRPSPVTARAVLDPAPPVATENLTRPAPPPSVATAWAECAVPAADDRTRPREPRGDPGHRAAGMPAQPVSVPIAAMTGS
jgi:hypothetical protein